ncbi:hypothetical protein N182_11180 [Sinorhizobium sp. GL2]|nr:hypothetical protein N182_11180 [Sinorhizobium sp. GL2]
MNFEEASAGIIGKDRLEVLMLEARSGEPGDFVFRQVRTYRGKSAAVVR